jgi:hypothetical protein
MTISWWQNLNLTMNKLLPIFQQFGELQERTVTAKDTRRHGNTETSHISVCFDHETGKVQERSCRLDLRQINKSFADKALARAA